MNGNIPDDLQHRILGLLDGTLEGSEIERLDAELRASRAARGLYRQLSALHSALESQGASQSHIRSVPMIPMERLLARQRRRAIRISLLATAAVMLISLAALWMKMMPAAPARHAEFRLGPDSAYTLIHSVEEGTTAPSGNVLSTGSRLRLSRGTMEATFGSGVRCVIEAPCDLTVLADDRISIAEGVAWFEVPHQAVGFTVETDQLTVVDLGTKFGVLALPGKDPEVHVTKGSVEVATRQAADTSRKLILTTGQALRLGEGGSLEPTIFKPSRFMKALPEKIFILNHSFERDKNPSINGDFKYGTRDELGGELAGWVGGGNLRIGITVGWKDIQPDELDPNPAEKGRRSQALSLMNGSGVRNTTSTAWSSLQAGDELTLTISLGMRDGSDRLNWNEGTFFGLTDGDFRLSGYPAISDTVANSGRIANNPATGTQEGDGTFTDVSFNYKVTAEDLTRKGNIGILIHAQGSGAEPARNQSFFDNVRLQRKKAPDR